MTIEAGSREGGTPLNSPSSKIGIGLSLGASMGVALGAAFGLERLIMAMKAAGITPPDSVPRNQTYVLAMDESCVDLAMEVAHQMRQAGASVRFDLAKKSFKFGLKAAIKNQCAWMIAFGEQERG